MLNILMQIDNWPMSVAVVGTSFAAAWVLVAIIEGVVMYQTKRYFDRD